MYFVVTTLVHINSKVITSVEIIIYVLVPQHHVQLSATAIALIMASLILITFVVPITFIIGYLFGGKRGQGK